MEFTRADIEEFERKAIVGVLLAMVAAAKAKGTDGLSLSDLVYIIEKFNAPDFKLTERDTTPPDPAQAELSDDEFEYIMQRVRGEA